MFPKSNASQASYVLLGSEGPDHLRPSRLRTSHLRDLFSVLIPLALILSVGTACFYAGVSFASSSEPKSSIPLTYHTLTFAHSPSHDAPPSPSTNQAWTELLPPHGSFFTEPTIAPARSTLSVFHYIHCLSGMRQAYFLLLDQAFPNATYSVELSRRSSGAPPETFASPADLPDAVSPMHYSHCLDLLRTALMCRPDTRIERREKVPEGVRGFGTEHVCADWGELVGMIGGWQESYG